MILLGAMLVLEMSGNLVRLTFGGCRTIGSPNETAWDDDTLRWAPYGRQYHMLVLDPERYNCKGGHVVPPLQSSSL